MFSFIYEQINIFDKSYKCWLHTKSTASKLRRQYRYQFKEILYFAILPRAPKVLSDSIGFPTLDANTLNRAVQTDKFNLDVTFQILNWALIFHTVKIGCQNGVFSQFIDVNLLSIDLQYKLQWAYTMW